MLRYNVSAFDADQSPVVNEHSVSMKYNKFINFRKTHLGSENECAALCTLF